MRGAAAAACARGVARNPSAPAALLLRLLASHQHRESLVGRVPRLPDSVYDAVVAHPSPEVRRHLAENPHAPGSQRGRLAEDPDPQVRLRVARPPVAFRTPVEPLPEPACARLAADRVPGIRLALALALALAREARVLPTAVLEVLLLDPDPQVRTAALVRAGGTRALRLLAHADEQEEWRVWSVVDTDDPELMRRAVRSAQLGLRRSAAYNPGLPGELAARLARDPDHAVRLLLCENHPAAPPRLLWGVWHEARVITRDDLLGRPGFPLERFAPLAQSEDPAERCLALRGPDLDPAVVDRLSRDPDGTVRSAAAGHPGLSPDRLLELLDDTWAAEAAAAHPALPVWAMEAVLAEANIPS